MFQVPVTLSETFYKTAELQSDGKSVRLGNMMVYCVVLTKVLKLLKYNYPAKVG